MTGWRAWVAELIGTFAFVTIGAGSAVASNLTDAGHLGVAAAHGLGLAVIVTVFAGISGGHLNPAVTLGVVLARRMRWVDAAGYWVAQLAGGLAGALVVRGLVPGAAANSGAPAVTGQVSEGAGLLLEVVFTFFLVLAVWGTGVDERAPKVGGFAIGLVVFVSILVIGPLTGAALNPARYLGPALVGGDLSQAWIYFLGPIGGALAGLVYPFLYLRRRERPVTA